MSKTGKLIPKRRFGGFINDNEWKKNFLHEISEVYDGTHQTPNYTKAGIMFLSVENIKTLHSEKFISKEAYEKDFKIKPERNDILMTRIGDIGTANIIKYDIPIAYYVSLALIKAKLNAYFLKANITSPYIQAELWKRTLHIAFPKKINKSEIENVLVKYPDRKEQILIGEFFKKLDALIQTQQKKLEKTKTLKSAYLAEMFPCDGELKPHYRFQCFNEVWTKNLFYNLANIRRGLTYNPSHLTNDGIRILRSSNIDEDRFIIKDDDIFINEKNVNIPVVSENDVLITAANGSSRLVGKHALISLPKSQKAVHGGFMLLATSKQPFFTNALLSSNWYRKFLNVYIAGGNGSIGNLNKKTIENQLIKIPSTKEQTKIGNFFKLLDKKIALEQRKLEKLNNIKQAYLNEMFV
ncbi:restriction endonuclease subunit S [Gilliamella apicola]|uniref:restriction endonuclease subunit S n=2 Tax=Gilliamella apicola TaxID=1196095 RepID=UPI002FEE3BC8